MPTTFWLSLALLVVLALVFVLQPVVFHRHSTPVTNRRVQNLNTYRSRLKELEQERDEGMLDESAFETLRDELELSMLQDVGPEEARDPEPRREGRRLLGVMTVLLCLLIPLGAFYLYGEFGSRQALSEFRDMQEMRSGDVTRQDVEKMVEGLRQRLEHEPNNPQGWSMLARSYMQLERHKAAAEAYKGLATALEKIGEGEPASAWGLRAQALFVANQGQVTSGVEAAIEQARARNPDEINALSIMGIKAFRAGDFRQAVEHWERILEVAPDHPQADSIRQGVAAAYSELGEPVPSDVLSDG
jgi:cytochrome c-type biogenesis protein CcmH